MTKRAAPRPALELGFEDNRRLAVLVGPHDRNLAELEQLAPVRLTRRGNQIAIFGDDSPAQDAGAVLRLLYQRIKPTGDLGPDDIAAEWRRHSEGVTGDFAIRTRRGVIRPRTRTQAEYLRALQGHELVFGLGPAGTGKTYLAVAMAVQRLLKGEVRRLVLSRPAVEAGERLGFLPGDLKEKVDPYLRPLYDALYDMLPGEQVQRLIDAQDIEIAPLAFMRGRTLSHSFIILDEAQNATPGQMRMFLTRLGEGSAMAVTGDPSQSDLPPGQTSGLSEAAEVLQGTQGVAFVRFSAADVVRHELVTRVVKAYQAHDAETGPPGAARRGR